MGNVNIDALRKSIIDDFNGRIEALKTEMEAELSMLDRIEERAKGLEKKPPILRRRLARKPSEPGVKLPSGRERILAAKNTVSGKFSRKELHDAVNKDGYGEMRLGTFSPYVSEMVGVEIVQVEKAVGNTPAVYMWKDEFEKLQTEPSPASNTELF